MVSSILTAHEGRMNHSLSDRLWRMEFCQPLECLPCRNRQFVSRTMCRVSNSHSDWWWMEGGSPDNKEICPLSRSRSHTASVSYQGSLLSPLLYIREVGYWSTDIIDSQRVTKTLFSFRSPCFERHFPYHHLSS